MTKLDDDRLRHAHRCTLSAVYFAYSGLLPRNVAPAARRVAEGAVAALKSAKIAAHPLTGSELSRIKRLIAKWQRRAEGKDPRYEVMGTRPGAPTNAQRERMLLLGWSSKHVIAKESARGVSTFACPECGATTPRNRKDQKWCRSTSTCRTRAYRRAQRAYLKPV